VTEELSFLVICFLSIYLVHWSGPRHAAVTTELFKAVSTLTNCFHSDMAVFFRISELPVVSFYGK
jgi:hypothetical protein